MTNLIQIKYKPNWNIALSHSNTIQTTENKDAFGQSIR